MIPETNVKVYELLDQQKSTFILEGTEHSGNPVHLSTAALTRIPNISMRKITKGAKSGKWERIRYIKNCPTIVEAEQIAQGYKPNVASGADEIYFEAGKRFVPTDVDQSLVEFLDSYASNISNKDRKPDATPLFKELTEEQEVRESVDEFFTQFRVMEYLNELAVKDGDRFKYAEDKIDNLCALLQISGFDPSQYLLKFKAILNYATADPQKFFTQVADRNAETKTLLLSAISLGVIGWKENNLDFTDGSRTIVSVSATGDKEKLEEAVSHLLKGSAYQDTALLTIAVKAARDKKLALQQ